MIAAAPTAKKKKIKNIIAPPPFLNCRALAVGVSGRSPDVQVAPADRPADVLTL